MKNPNCKGKAEAESAAYELASLLLGVAKLADPDANLDRLLSPGSEDAAKIGKARLFMLLHQEALRIAELLDDDPPAGGKGGGA